MANRKKREWEEERKRSKENINAELRFDIRKEAATEVILKPLEVTLPRFFILQRCRNQSNELWKCGCTLKF